MPIDRAMDSLFKVREVGAMVQVEEVVAKKTSSDEKWFAATDKMVA